MKIQTLPINKYINFNGIYLVNSTITAHPNQTTNRGTIDLYNELNKDGKNNNTLYTHKGAISASNDFSKPSVVLTNDSKGADVKTYLDFADEYKKTIADYGQKDDKELRAIADDFIKEKRYKEIDGLSHVELKNYVNRLLEKQQRLEKEKLGKLKIYTQINEKYKEARANMMSKSFDELKVFAKTMEGHERPKTLVMSSGQNLVNYVRRMAREHLVKKEAELYEQILKKATKINGKDLKAQAKTILQDIITVANKI